jgi:hypothetical protein
VNAVFAGDAGEICRLVDEARGGVSGEERCNVEAVKKAGDAGCCEGRGAAGCGVITRVLGRGEEAQG